MANESLRFDIVGVDSGASAAFSKVGGSVRDMGGKMDLAAKSAALMDEALRRQQTAARASVDATLSLAKSDGILAEAEHVLRDGALEAEFALKRETEAKKKSGDAALEAAAKNKKLGDSLRGGGFAKIGAMFGGGSGASGGGGLASALPAASGLVNPYTVVAGAAAAPFAGQVAAGGVVAGFGAALAGLAVLGASKTKSVEASFKDLKKHANEDLAQIGKPFVPVMNDILRTATSVMGKLTPVFQGAERVIAGPFRQFGDTLLKSFNQPAVKTSIDAIAVSFAKLLGAVTPQLPGMIKSIADGITNIAHAVSANPKAFADFVSFLFKAAGAALDTIAWLTRVASYIEAHFAPAMHRTAVIFDGVRHDIAHTWDQIFQNTIGTVIRLNHGVEVEFNDFRHRTAVVFDGARHDIAHIWDMTWSNTVGRMNRGSSDTLRILSGWEHNVAHWFDVARHDIASAWDTAWNNTVGRVSRGVNDVVRWIGTLPGRARSALGSLGSQLWAIGSQALRDLWNGMKAGASSIGGWLQNFAKGVVGIFKKVWGWFSPSRVMYEGGKSLMDGLAKGIQDHAHKAQAAASAVANKVANVGSGVQRWKGLVDQALRANGLPVSLDANVLYQMQTESGGNPNAINLTDSNAAAGDPSRGLMQTIMSTFRAYHMPGTSNNIYDPYANIAASIRYAKAVYGPNLANQYGGIGSGHGYATGTMSAAPGWAWVGERGPELMHFRGGEQVIPAARAAASTTIIVKVEPAVAAVTPDRQLGRQIAQHLTAFVKVGGHLYPPGTAPR